MSYANQSVASLLRSPLLHTPQGLVVLVIWVLHLVLLPFVYTNTISLLGKSSGASIVICVLWPFITSLYFIREGTSSNPDFEPSVPRALWLLLIGIAPLLWPLKDKLLSL